MENKIAAAGGAYVIKRLKPGEDPRSVPEAPIDKVLWLPDAGVRGFARLFCRGDSLRVDLRAAEEHVRAEHTAPLSPVCEDSCLEFFFAPAGSRSYFNFELNPNGCLCLQYGPSRADRFDIVRRGATEYFDIRASRTAEGWRVSYRIPLEFIRTFCPGFEFAGEMRGNFYKCGDKTVREHYLSWAPVGTETPDFHRPEFFAPLIFE